MTSNLATIKDKLMGESAVGLFMDYLPTAVGKEGQKLARRYAKMVYAYISQNPTLQQCSLGSLIRSASQLASVNLEIDARGLAYLVPYKNKGVLEAQAQISYLGLMELAYRSEQVKSITANCIYESELRDVKITRRNGRYEVVHPFSYATPTGKIIAVYATAEVDGIGAQTMVLRADEVEKFRAMSKAPNSPAWVDHTEAMYKKTAIRQLAKFLPKSVAKEFSTGAAIDEREDFVESAASAHERIKNELGSETITEFENPEEAESQTDDAKSATKSRKSSKKREAKKEEKQDGDARNTERRYLCRMCGYEFDKDFKKDETIKCPKCLRLEVSDRQNPDEDFLKDD